MDCEDRGRIFRDTVAGKMKLAVCVALCCGINLLPGGLFPMRAANAQPDATTIIQRSLVALRADWEAAPQYSYYERDVEDHGTKTYEIMMILGSPYRRLVAINRAQLSGEAQKEEQRKLDRAIAHRRSESKEETGKRVAGYQRERHRDHQMMGRWPMPSILSYVRRGDSKLPSLHP